ncbi:Hypothetical protein A7982_01930 [Minicystis rosea]|nr:Hypothetical protein A7982_01930 [Minicystis rosea]
MGHVVRSAVGSRDRRRLVRPRVWGRLRPHRHRARRVVG